MATFLMIHGACHGGWCFEPLRPFLASRGHALIAPTLPGMDGGDMAVADVTLDLWADFVADLARRQNGPVILCGHSRGGIVISSAAERAPEAIRSLVYITAFLLPSGQSLRAFQLAAPNPRFAATMSPNAERTAVVFNRATAAEVLYHRVSKAGQDEALARLVPEPMKPLATPLALSEARFGRVPRHYIECSDDRAILPARQREMRDALPCASVATLDCDHSPFLSSPGALADALGRIAAGPGDTPLVRR
ncbi:MAG: alpha/beta fold hydrolase [Panacagrimonas sp.]